MSRLQTGNAEGARAIWREALENNPDDTGRASFLLMMGLSYFMEGDVEQASPWLAEGTMIQEAGIDDLRSEEMVIKYLGNQQVYYNALIESLVSGGKIEQGFEAAERARARAFLRLLGNRRLEPPTGSEMTVVRQAEKLRKTIDNWDSDPQPGTTLVDLRRQYEGLLSRVQVVAEYASLTSVGKFYDHLLAGATAADALRAAQTALLRNPKLANPRFWAAFFLTGDPRSNWKRASS